MSVVNRVKNFFSRSYVSHYDDNGNLKNFEHFRIDLVKELDYMVLKHKFHIREKTNSAGIYNLFQSSLGDIVDDLYNFTPINLPYDIALASFYSATLVIDYFTMHRVNPISWGHRIAERFSSPGAFIWGPKVSEFHDYGYMRDDPYHYPRYLESSLGKEYNGRDYEDLIRESSLEFYHNHKKMMEYDNSSYVKLAVISFTDIIEDTATFISLGFEAIWNFALFRIRYFWEDLLESSKHLGNIFYNLAAGIVYSICAVVENFDHYVDKLFEAIDNSVILLKNDIEYYINDKIYQLFGQYAKDISSKGFDILEHSYFISSDIVRLTYHTITFSGEKAIGDVFDIFSNMNAILFDTRDIFECLGFKIKETTTNYYHDLDISQKIIEQIDYSQTSESDINSQNSFININDNFLYYLNSINSQVFSIKSNLSEIIHNVYDNCFEMMGMQTIDENI